jgi:predicted phosphoribosyltransferase
MLFRDRTHAGRCLAAALADFRGNPSLLVLGLPRGGVVVAFSIDEAIRARLDVFLVRKLGVPGQEELAMGAIADGNVLVKNQSVLASADISQAAFDVVLRRERAELARREAAYRSDRLPPEIAGRSIVLVDDGLATGATMRAAIEGVRLQRPAQIAVAVPVAAASVCEPLQNMVEDFICLETPEPFFGVGQWYQHFRQISDEEVRQLLDEASRRLPAA